MKVLFIKDKNKRHQYFLLEKKKIFYKYIINNLKLPKKIKILIYKKMLNLPLNSSQVRISNRCVISNRSKSVYRKFKLSRIVLRDLASKGDLMGIKKASW